MMVFNQYAKFYDALYEEKKYDAECVYLEQLFSVFSSKSVDTILELGCGTGGHALILADRGYKVTGVDRSEAMLQAARAKDTQKKIDWHLADIRKIVLNRKFDAVISMFAVMSYMATNVDLMAAFATASNHLRSGGLFVFDGWYGPCVLSNPPTERYKEVTFNSENIIRYSRPAMDWIRQLVTVEFRVLRIKSRQVIEDVVEYHRIRPFFVQEIAFLSSQQEMEIVGILPFMRYDTAITTNDWNVSFVIRKL